MTFAIAWFLSIIILAVLYLTFAIRRYRRKQAIANDRLKGFYYLMMKSMYK